MLFRVHRFLLVFLGLLQFVAPLVHAHSGTHFSQYGVHLPTLEIYAVSPQQSIPAFQNLQSLTDFDGMIISINSGIENHQDNNDDLTPALYFPPHPLSITPALVSCEINFSPQPFPPLKEFPAPPQAPRAPPASL